MRASSGTSSEGSFPLTLVPANLAAQSAPAKAGTSASFEAVLLEQEGGPSNAPELKGKAPFGADNVPDQPAPSPTATSNGKTQAPHQPTAASFASRADEPPSPVAATVSEEITSQAGASVKSKPTALPAGSDLSAMIVQAAVLASNARQISLSKTPDAAATTTDGPENDSKATSAKNPSAFTSGGPDLLTLMAQVSILASSAQQASGPKASSSRATTVTAESGNDSKTTSTKNPAQLLSSDPDLSTLMAQVSILVSSAQQASQSKTPSGPMANSATGLSKELPLSGLSKGGAGSPAKEKKSAPASAEGIFIQSTTASSDADSSSLGMVGLPLTSANELFGRQQLTPAGGLNNPSLQDLSGSAFSIAGTANVEKGKAMNTDLLNFPEIFSGYETNPLSQQSPADIHILLSSNHDFEDALTQVMHVAQLTQTNESRAPMRVEMEIQTPPGAIVNVYVSRQNDQWRAQLSTNDPQALSWVQDKMSSLRQAGDFGVEVRWLPPQMESSSGHDANLAWDRGGQGQSNYQQPDERPQSQRQKKAGVLPSLASILSNPFSDKIHALGRAA